MKTTRERWSIDVNEKLMVYGEDCCVINFVREREAKYCKLP